MYWMLLPPNANVGRPLTDAKIPLRDHWNALVHGSWARFLRALMAAQR
jgi:hypothetical protein